MARAEGKSKKGGRKIDFATVGGVLVALGAIVGGLILEGGKISGDRGTNRHRRHAGCRDGQHPYVCIDRWAQEATGLVSGSHS